MVSDSAVVDIWPFVSFCRSSKLSLVDLTRTRDLALYSRVCDNLESGELTADNTQLVDEWCLRDPGMTPLHW